MGDLFSNLSMTNIIPMLSHFFADGKDADRLMFHMSIVIEENHVEIDILDVILRNEKCETFVVDRRLSRSFDGTSFLHQTLLFVEHVDFKIRI